MVVSWSSNTLPGYYRRNGDKMMLFLDDNPSRHETVEAIRPGEVIHAYTVDQFVDALRNPAYESFDTVSLDHDLNDFDCRSLYQGQEATGLDACGIMVANPDYVAKLPETIHIHSVNPCGANNMRAFLERRGYTVRWIPFSV
jgi:hypothetical protein